VHGNICTEIWIAQVLEVVQEIREDDNAGKVKKVGALVTCMCECFFDYVLTHARTRTHTHTHLHA